MKARQIGELRASHAHGAERCAHLRAHTICLSECTRNLLVRTLDDQAGVLIHPHDEGKSIRKRGIARRGPVAYLKRSMPMSQAAADI